MTANIQYVLGEKGKDVLPTYYIENNLLHAGHEKKVFLGERGKKMCRFCLRDASATTFKKEAHLIPEFTGNNILFSYFECDECNVLFSRYETAFANYFGIHHTFARLVGKNKVPQYNSKKEKFSVVPSDDTISMFSGEGNNSVTIDEQSQTMTIKTIRPSYIPRDALKCLVKIGLCAVKENELPFYEETRRWLRNEIDENVYPSYPLFIIYYNIGGGLRARSPFVVVLNKKEGAPVPQSTVLIAYDHFKFQLFMPFDTRNQQLWEGPKVLLPIQGHLVREREDGKGLSFFWKDLSGTAKVVGEEQTFSMGTARE